MKYEGFIPPEGINLMPLFDMIFCEARVIRYELELPRAQLELTSRLAAPFLKPAHPDWLIRLSKEDPDWLIGLSKEGRREKVERCCQETKGRSCNWLA